MTEPQPDAIGQAIDATEAVAQLERVLAQKRAETHRLVDELEPLNLNISSTGGHAAFVFHPDMTSAELFEVIGYLSHALRLELDRRAEIRAGSAGPMIEIARAMPAGMPPPPMHGKNGKG